MKARSLIPSRALRVASSDDFVTLDRFASRAFLLTKREILKDCKRSLLECYPADLKMITSTHRFVRMFCALMQAHQLQRVIKKEQNSDIMQVIFAKNHKCALKGVLQKHLVRPRGWLQISDLSY